MDIARTGELSAFAAQYSVNPLFILPFALNARAEHIARRFSRQFMGTAGQDGLQSRLLVAPDSAGFVDLRESLAEAIATLPAALVNADIHAGYLRGVARRRSTADVEPIAEGMSGSAALSVQALMFETDVATLLSQPWLMNEVSGPIALLVRCPDPDRMLELAGRLGAQLSAAMQMDDDDLALAVALMHALKRAAATIVINGLPGPAALREQAGAQVPVSPANNRSW